MKYVADDGCIYGSIEEAEKADKEFANVKANRELKESKLRRAEEEFKKATDEYKETIKVAAEKFEKAQNEYVRARKECDAEKPFKRDYLSSIFELLGIC